MEQIIDSDPGFRAVAQNVPEMAQNWKIELLLQFLCWDSAIFRISLPYHVQKIHGPNFQFGAQFLSNGPKGPKWPEIKKLNYSYSFWATKLISLGNVYLPKSQKFMEQIFDSGPSFWAVKRARNGPKLKNWTPPTVFELGSSYFGMVLTYPWAKHSWHDLLFGSRFLGWFLFLHWDPFEGIRCLLKLSLGLKIRGIDYLVSF